MNYFIFEDNQWKNFLPFTYTRFTGDMRVGILKLRQRIGLYFGFEPENIIIREDLQDLYTQRHPDWAINKLSAGEYTFINSRVRINNELKEKIITLNLGEKLVLEDTVLAFKVKIEMDGIFTAETLPELYKALQTVVYQGFSDIWNHTWDFIVENGNVIKEDFKLVFSDEDNLTEIDPGVTAINPYDIWIGENAVLNHGVILDATNGPIVIDENATVMHNTVILGPAYIGKNSVVRIGTKVYQNTTIGPFSKVGGELHDTIIQAYSNKQHDGFLGNCYVGEWVNIGADTNNSDLKNTYKPVKVWFYPDKAKKSTENLFIGSFIGDHTNIGINCSLNTGVVLGFGVNIYGSDLISDFIPSFMWGEAKNMVEYKPEKFLETAKCVKSRRKEELSDKETELIKKIKEISMNLER